MFVKDLCMCKTAFYVVRSSAEKIRQFSLVEEKEKRK